jgi:uncharacterized repeat protein (TIGR01451 family)
MSHPQRATWWRVFSIAIAILLLQSSIAIGVDGDTPTLRPGAQPISQDEEEAQFLLERDLAFSSRRTAGDIQLDNQTAGALRATAARDAARLRNQGAPALGIPSFAGLWSGIGPNPIVQQTRSTPIFNAMSGRIGALAIRPSNGQIILAAAQGGIWLYNSGTGKWVPKTDNLASLAMGALAIAPSNDLVIYAGTGEGALSGDSYFGNGILKSSDGGANWAQVSGDYFVGVSISRLVVDPGNASHLYAAVLRGRGGARRTSPTAHSKWGIWESTDGAVTWTLKFEMKNESNGATDLEMDPQHPNILYASFWGDSIYKSTDGGNHWSPIMTGLPTKNNAANATRWSISLSHPASVSPVLYAGSDYIDDAGAYHVSRVFKSTDEGAHWTLLPDGSGGPQGTDDSVGDYCGAQCFYDNVIEADPTNPNVVFAGGQFNYDIGSGGIFRSDDGGTTWKNLGWDQHPDYHALAFDAKNPGGVVVGSDGGVWYSSDLGGRPSTADPLSAVTWDNLNGIVDPNNAGTLFRTDLQISQFSSIATVPQAPLFGLRFWGGTQDNGTIRKSGGSNSWFDVSSGDGGQVLVDPTVDACLLGPACYVYGTYTALSPYRYTDGGNFFTNQYIRSGINLSDRSDFYVPFVMNKLNTNQLYIGSYRLYRTDNARAGSAGDVKWNAISPDLTGGCTGTAPNGARTCALSAIGVGGGTGVYTGSLDGLVYVSSDAQVNSSPSWTRVDIGQLPKRPVSQFAVDRSNYRIAYAAYNGFNQATPSRPGHVFKTTDGGNTWVDISGNLPNSPVNSIILDPSYANTLYAGTDVGPFVTTDGGVNWYPMGSGFPIVSIWQLDLDPGHRIMAAGTHGRGAFKLQDTNLVPALVLSKVDANQPVGPATSVDYTLTLRNIGNASATGVEITDPIPANTSFVSADAGGSLVNGKVTWSGITIPAGGSVTVHFSVNIASALKNKVKSIVNDGFTATSAEGPFTTGSPVVTPIANPFAVGLTPAAQTDGTRAGTSVDYHVSVRNLGFTTDSYNLTSSGGTYSVSILDSTCTSAMASTGSLIAGATADVCVEVAVPGGASNGDTNVATVSATSVGNPATSASGTLTTIAVTVDTLLVDNDGNGPNVQSFYTTALTDAGVPFSVWDLSVDPNLPLHYMEAFSHIVWFTGNSYPGPILPYEAKLAAYLDNGGHLFMSGWDILDQAAGTTAFVHDYLHVAWDGSETQNDKATANVAGVGGNPVTNTIGTVPLNTSVLGGANFMDRLTLVAPATSAFTDDSAADDGLTVDTGTYKVVFLAFPFEAYGTATDRSDLINFMMTWFGP